MQLGALGSELSKSLTKIEIQNLYYNKAVTDEKLNLKGNLIDLYTNTQLNKLLFLKSDKDESLTTIEIQNL